MTIPPPQPTAPVAPPDAWLRAKEVFGDVATLPLDQRARVLDLRCGDDVALRQFVEALLRSNDVLSTERGETADLGLGPVLRRALEQSWLQVERGHRFGAFAVVEEIGRGGMGIVYLAERHDGKVVQRVALKLVPTLYGEASQRLARERRLLAALEHPNIARLIDAGEDPNGIPYFAMEYVQGAPITLHCDRLALSLPQRLRLFRQVCAAVQYAHANLIVHCDIKAGNILVTDSGLPKLLDFGIATTLDAARSDGDAGEPRFLSPRTAAPEQFLGQPTSVATDIYALGVLLYELCTGQRPFADTDEREELRRRVLQDMPPLPSRVATAESAQRCGGLALPALQRRLAGDIDAIVAKALSKTPLQRYASVEQLDADIARHLEKRPVQARAGEPSYRFVRYLQRNALAVVFAVAVIGFAIVLAGLLASFAARTARQNAQLAHERDQAHQREQQAEFERARAQQVTDFVVGLFKASMPLQARGREVSARELLERGSRQLRGSLGDQPQLKATMLVAIAEAYFALDNLDGAEAAAREAFTLRAALRPLVPHDQIDSLKQLATVANSRGRFAEALALVEQGRTLALVFTGTTDPADLPSIRARALVGLGRSNDALAAWREVLALQSRAYGPRDIRSLRAATQVANALDRMGLVNESEQVLLDYLPHERSQSTADDPEYGEMLLSLARLAQGRKDFAKADSLASESLAIFRKVYGDQTSQSVIAMSRLAIIAQERGDYARSLSLFEEALAAMRVIDDSSPTVAVAEFNVGMLLFGSLHRPVDAIAHFQRAVDRGEKLYPPGHSNLAFYRMGLGAALRAVGRLASAEVVLRQALRDFEAINAPRGINVARVRGELACIALARGQKQARAELAAVFEVIDRYPELNESSLVRRLRDCAGR